MLAAFCLFYMRMDACTGSKIDLETIYVLKCSTSGGIKANSRIYLQFLG